MKILWKELAESINFLAKQINLDLTQLIAPQLVI